MISLITNQHGDPVTVTVAGRAYTPDSLIAALSNARALQAALGLSMRRNVALLERCEQAEQWVALLEAERKIS